MSVLSIICLILYGICSIVNLLFCLLLNEKLRKATKPLCMLGLIGFVLSTLPTHFFLWISLMLAWIGDILFIFKHKRVFMMLGMFAFLLAHALYVFEFGYIFRTQSEEVFASYCFLLRFYPILILPGIPIGYYLSNKDWKLTIAGAFYQSMLFGVFASAIFAIVVRSTPYFIFVAVGAILYYTSDAVNAYTLCKKKFKMKELVIMSTYLVAQFFIVFGIYSANFF